MQLILQENGENKDFFNGYGQRVKGNFYFCLDVFDDILHLYGKFGIFFFSPPEPTELEKKTLIYFLLWLVVLHQEKI